MFGSFSIRCTGQKKIFHLDYLDQIENQKRYHSHLVFQTYCLPQVPLTCSTNMRLQFCVKPSPKVLNTGHLARQPFKHDHKHSECLTAHFSRTDQQVTRDMYFFVPGKSMHCKGMYISPVPEKLVETDWTLFTLLENV